MYRVTITREGTEDEITLLTARPWPFENVLLKDEGWFQLMDLIYELEAAGQAQRVGSPIDKARNGEVRPRLRESSE